VDVPFVNVAVPASPTEPTSASSQPEVELVAAATTSVTVVVVVKLLEVPVIVTVTVPVLAVLPAVSVKMLLEVAGLGLYDAVTPLGQICHVPANQKAADSA
jgi:hypothetical protein